MRKEYEEEMDEGDGNNDREEEEERAVVWISMAERFAMRSWRSNSDYSNHWLIIGCVRKQENNGINKHFNRVKIWRTCLRRSRNIVETDCLTLQTMKEVHPLDMFQINDC